jgi:predicted nuclease of predicted toxin-antitoxin system
MKFKLDENLSPSLATLFSGITSDVYSVTHHFLNGAPDERVIDACTREGRTPVSMDLDFSNIRAYPPSQYSGIVVLRLQNQAHAFVEAAVRRMVTT